VTLFARSTVPTSFFAATAALMAEHILIPVILPAWLRCGAAEKICETSGVRYFD